MLLLNAHELFTAIISLKRRDPHVNQPFNLNRMLQSVFDTVQYDNSVSKSVSEPVSVGVIPSNISLAIYITGYS